MTKKVRKPPTMNDVAREAGVTQATVSYVLNQTGDISEAVKKRVLESADKLGYIRNTVARNLKMKRANTIGIIVPDVTNNYYSEIIKHVEKIIREKGFFAFICITNYNPEIEDWYVTSLVEQKAAGVVACYGLINHKSLVKCVNYNVPFVVLDDDLQQSNVEASCVLVNNIKGSFIALQHFVALGLTNIAYCSQPLLNLPLKDRHDGFLQAIKEFGLKKHVVIMDKDENDKIAMGYRATEIIMSNGKPEGIFAANDQMAFGVIKKLAELGVKVPQEIAVIGYDNVPLASIVSPTLTTINQPVITMCIQGTNMLFGLINGKEHTVKRIMLEPSIIVRGSA